MIPVSFPEANSSFGPPPDLEESKCMAVPAYTGTVERGSLEGTQIVIVAWKLSPQDIEALQAGSPIFLSVLGGLPPHFLSTSFEQASHPG